MIRCKTEDHNCQVAYHMRTPHQYLTPNLQRRQPLTLTVSAIIVVDYIHVTLLPPLHDSKHHVLHANVHSVHFQLRLG